eukprot:542559_1
MVYLAKTSILFTFTSAMAIMLYSYLTLLFSLFVLSVESESSFNHFTIKQCEINGNCQKKNNSILIAIDGTATRIKFEESNRPKKYKSQIGVNNNKEWIWQSHVANFWEDYQGTSYYFYGPDSSEMFFAGREIDNIVEQSHIKICEFMNNYLSEYEISEDISSSILNDFGIDLIGFSRGGFAAMELARALQFDGCYIKTINIKPITVRFMGLYDPVERDIDFTDLIDGYNDNEIAENVLSVSIAKRSEFIHSRSYFGYAVESDNHQQDQKIINATHGSIGGTPAKSDCKQMDRNILQWFIDPGAMICSEMYTDELDKKGAIETEIYMRKDAIKANVPIRDLGNPEKYFGDFIDFIEIE